MGKIPDTEGWYWIMDNDCEWRMAFVDTSNESVFVLPGDIRGGCSVSRLAFAEVSERFDWYGPFSCPGGDFGDTTIVPSEDLCRDAAASGKAIVITYANYKFCRDEKHAASIAITQLLSREMADAAISPSRE